MAALEPMGWATRFFLVAFAVSFFTGIIAVVVMSLYILALLVPFAAAMALSDYIRARWKIRPPPAPPVPRQVQMPPQAG
jgi:hypothetical protein